MGLKTLVHELWLDFLLIFTELYLVNTFHDFATHIFKEEEKKLEADVKEEVDSSEAKNTKPDSPSKEKRKRILSRVMTKVPSWLAFDL